MIPQQPRSTPDPATYNDAARFAQHAANAINLLARILLTGQKTQQDSTGQQQQTIEALNGLAERIARIEQRLVDADERQREADAIAEARYVKLARALDEIGRDAKQNDRRTIARALSAFCCDAHRTFANPGDRDHARHVIAGLAADLGLDTIEPQPGAPFDPQTMAPAPGHPPLDQDPRRSLVTEVIAPGFRHDGVPLLPARVLLELPAPPNPHSVTITVNGSARCTNHEGAIR